MTFDVEILTKLDITPILIIDNHNKLLLIINLLNGVVHLITIIQ